ncbi:hypothetical protein Pedsa_0189 [Pseudopedobacter saltans DSM 12145]|uniref:DUF3052 domain-containing protein n=1 Tax=Pseudopedobacter saltans (strain ATCC 51119 / DSM 12145 / JCM 21818 / CCUG 39354 / LMG 10337 / NBRC 100064 / NCIMB 13643) TaxID=762903 RepID=F0SDP8_PSESL|nr:YdeI/OmpD-associated family protein [Pseudopedobacter saltans]ADY50775.1 hypothetical protein Pedsa_0189 [Pseudopedobacter saltans DSM 12145]
MDQSLIKKLKIKSGQKVFIQNAPLKFLDFINEVEKNFDIVSSEKNQDVIILFAKNSDELYSAIDKLQSDLSATTLFWICYPKKTSGIPTDLEMMSSWKDLEKYGLRPVASIAVDKNWTALQIKPIAAVKVSGSSNESIAKNELGEFIDVKNRIIKLPDYLEALLQPIPEAKNFFDSLSYTNKKEYLIWLLTAKQQKTKDERQKAFVEKLLNKKKNPSEK